MINESAPGSRSWWRWAAGIATVFAAALLVAQIDTVDLGALLTRADPAALGAAALLSLLPLVGAAVGLLVVSPVRLPVPATFAVQLATSFANLLTPASAGGSALLVRFLHRRRVSLPAAVAAVAFVHTASVLGSVGVVAAALFTAGRHIDVFGRLGGTGTALIALGVAGLAVLLWWIMRSGGTFLRRVRTGLVETWQQFRESLRRPGRVIGGVGAGLLAILGQTLAIGACLHAYGADLPLLSIAFALTAGTAAGAVIPLPGGIGATEAGLTAGLVLVGVEPATALLAALLYRLLTFWARVPLGWGCLIWLRRSGHV